MRVLIMCFLSCSLVMNTMVHAQFPETSLYALHLDIEDGDPEVTSIEYLSGFNPNGYNNQPYFVNKDQLLFTSNWYDSSLTDILKIDFDKKELSRVTHNFLSEYSPVIRPSTSGMSVVSVETNLNQCLRYFEDISNGQSKIILTDLKNVAYYNWITNDQLAICLLDEQVENQMNLAIASVNSSTYSTIVENVGRCIKVDPYNKEGFYFVHKLSEEFWYLKYYNFLEKKVTTIVQMITGVEDFELYLDGSIIIGNGSKLFRFIPELDQNWNEYYNLIDYGIKNIKRIVVSEDRLVICNLD